MGTNRPSGHTPPGGSQYAGIAARRHDFRRRRYGSAVGRLAQGLYYGVLITLVLMVWGIGNLYYAFAKVRKNIEQVVNIQLPQGSQATRVYARDYNAATGHGTLLATFFLENRQQADYSEIPPQLIACVLSTEDKNFFTHGGVDLLGTARAILRGASRGGDIRGTSTITQQLSRNVFLPYIKSQRTLNRKIQEVILAGALEKRFTKEEILEAYLNHTYFGARAYGVKAAALTYFGKDLDQLSLSECAMLAGMPQAPSKYNPFTNMDGAQVRRDSVLKLLDSRLSTDFIGHLKLADPQKFKDLDISSADIEKALKQPIKLSKKTAPGILRAPYFVEYLREHVLGPKYGRDRVAVDGLVVVTTIDPTYQEWAENILASELDKDRRSKRVSEGALVLLDAKTGEVLACVGGYKYGQLVGKGTPDHYNRALQASRQVGSSFKPFTYATAYEQGFDPNMLIDDAPNTTYKGKPWPRNSDGTYRGWMSMYYALQWSRNAAAVDLITNCTGIPPVIDTARKMGITANLDNVPALTLGVADIKPVEMAEAFDTFPNMGEHVKHVLIKRVYNENGILIESNDSPEAIAQRSNRVFSENTAWIMVQNMMRVVNAGTGTKARVSGVEIAGKTGTCDDFRDAWFVGYSPQLVCSVWVGNDDFGVAMNHMFGGQLPARIFNGLMKKIYASATSKKSAAAGDDEAQSAPVIAVKGYTQVKFAKPPGATFKGFGGGSAGHVGGGVGDEAEKPGADKPADQGSETAPPDDNGFYEPYQPPEEHVYF